MLNVYHLTIYPHCSTLEFERLKQLKVRAKVESIGDGGEDRLLKHTYRR